MSCLTVRADRGLVHAAFGGERHVFVSHEAMALRGERPRLPMNLSFVIDRSGSMRGDKIRTAILGTQEGIRRMGDQDRFSVVSYDDAVEITVPSTAGTAAGKEAAAARVAVLEPGGSTDLHAGWMKGCDQIAAWLTQGQVARCLLFTDGRVNCGVQETPTLVARAVELRSRGISTSTFGIGADFDEALLSRIADAGGGRARLVEHPSRLQEMLGAELTDTLDVVHRGAELHVRCPEGGRVEAIGPWPVRREGDRLVLSLGDLVSEEVTELVLRVRVPPGREGSTFTLDFFMVDREGPLEDAAATCAWRRVDEAANKAQPRDIAVDRVVAARHAARTREQAIEANRQGKREAARLLLLRVADRVGAYAGQDAEMNALIESLRQNAETYSRPMTPMEQKQAHYASNSALRGRDQTGSARRKG